MRESGFALAFAGVAVALLGELAAVFWVEAGLVWGRLTYRSAVIPAKTENVTRPTRIFARVEDPEE